MSKPIDAFGPPVALTAASPREGTSGAAARADHDHSTAGLGGGGGGTGFDRRWNVGASETSIDEFNDNSLAGAWTRVDSGGGAGRATWTEAADVLSVFNAGDDALAEIHAMMRPIGTSMSVGDAFITCLQCCGPIANYTMGGIVLADGITYGSGTQALAFTYISNAGTQLQIECRALTGYNSSPSVVGGTTASTGWLFSRLVMTAANTWRHDYSPDGVTWRLGTATLPLTLTPTYVGLLSSSWSTLTKGVVSYEFLRRVSGIS